MSVADGGTARTVAAVSAGGMLGSLARYGVAEAFPHAPGGFGWAMFAVNVSGCLLIGVLMAVITGRPRVHPLARPFLGVGVLGGFTSFSAYALDVQRAFQAGAPGVAVAYLVATVVCAPAAVYAGLRVTRPLVRRGGRP
ncbi:fluoride efflux transporter FluC [Thermomonospora amylolytica]|uniref:fluoride efflux transporter FluC n=1 Tax=Thermomonospora amylolytica TaxID=1411117 RepID=UPI000E6D2FAB|nr:CrcB family protein [Thermomonospora amylolytica]